MTKEESWKIVNEEMHLQNSVLFKAVHNATWRIASENQQKIDIDKACEWLKNNGCFSYLQEGSQTIEDIENIFRKAMQE